MKMLRQGLDVLEPGELGVSADPSAVHEDEVGAFPRFEIVSSGPTGIDELAFQPFHELIFHRPDT